MGLIATPPEIMLFNAMMKTLASIDFLDRAGVDGVKVRPGRQRPPLTDEKPCVSLVWTGNSDPDMNPDSQYRSQGERFKHCNFRLTIDDLINAEDVDLEDADLDGDPDDPSGWLRHSMMSAAAFDALRDPASPIMQLCSWITDGSQDPDEASKPNEGRLDRDVIVLYRVRTEDPNHILAVGVDYA